jgi:hypothetical protein
MRRASKGMTRRAGDRRGKWEQGIGAQEIKKGREGRCTRMGEAEREGDGRAGRMFNAEEL